jgi:hypothetical protein
MREERRRFESSLESDAEYLRGGHASLSYTMLDADCLISNKNSIFSGSA